MRGTALSISW